MKILFVDDDDFRTKPLRDELTDFAQYEIVLVKTPKEAVEKFKEFFYTFDAVIVDIMLPHCDIPDYKNFTIPRYFASNNEGIYTGLKVLVQFYDIMQHNNRYVPVIVLTCIGDIKKYLDELNIKVNATLLKPILPADFRKEVRNVFVSQKS